jgi:hypothetical protein
MLVVVGIAFLEVQIQIYEIPHPTQTFIVQ